MPVFPEEKNCISGCPMSAAKELERFRYSTLETRSRFSFREVTSPFALRAKKGAPWF